MKHTKIIGIMVLFFGAMVFVGSFFGRSASSALQEGFGTVTYIADGDTFDIAWDTGDEHPNGYNRIRVAGVDTNEIAGSECLAHEATTRLEQIIPVGSRVKLVAEDLGSSSQSRALRHVFYGPGFKNNLAIAMINGGLGLPASFANEPSFKSTYFRAGEWAMINEVGLWEEGVCGGNPATWPSIEGYVNYDAEGDDTKNVNGEYIEIRNTGLVSLSMSGWTIRGSARLNDQTHTLPAGRTVNAGAVHRIYSGKGINTSTKTYLGLNSPWLNNETDVVYLRDTNLNMRLTKFWPCTFTCGPEASVIVEDVSYDAPGDDGGNPNGEWVRLRNVGNKTINLENWRVRESGKTYKFDSSDSIAAGKRMILYIGKGTDSSSKKYWGNSSGILNNSGNDKITVLNPDSVEIDCYSWGPTNFCKGENIRGAVRVYANFNASGRDSTNPNGEWVSLHNTSASTVNLTGYRLYTPGYSYSFPSGTTIKPGANLRVRSGKGTRTSSNHYWGNSKDIYKNGGDYVKLLKGSELIAMHKWPCKVSCGYSHGLVIERVNYNAPGDDTKNPNGEWIRIKNTSSAEQNLRNWKVKVGPYQLVSIASRPMQPGGSIKIYMGKGANTSTKMYWGKSKGILPNSGSRTVELLSPLRHEARCYDWGIGSCK